MPIRRTQAHLGGEAQAALALDNYCSQLGSLLERRHTELALIESKRQAETAAALARDAMLRAQAADRAKTTFLANMSHELRTPLNAIIGFSEMIKLNISTPNASYQEYVDCILDAGHHLLGVIGDILDLARIEAGRIELGEDVVSIHEIVATSVRTVRSLAEKKTIAIDYPAAPGDLQLRLDPVKIKQVFVNILSNAIKFTEAGGRIAIAPRIERTGDLLIAFSDSGIGIPPESLDKVLQPFEQMGGHLTRQNEGTGLGLPIARALVRLHGGELTLDSEVGVGTTVSVRLPAERVRIAFAPAAE